MDGDTYFLTTDHFLEKALSQTTSSNAADRSRREITSPSLYDVHDVRSSLDASIKGADIEIADVLELYDELTPSEVREFDGYKKELVDWAKRLRIFRQELSKPDESFVLGEVKKRCGQTETEVWHNGSKVLRKMDWALCSVKNERKGENRHRHQDWTPSENFFEEEGHSPRGAGEVCTQTSQPREGARVHYVGAGTGYQEASINPPETLASRGYKVTHEWSLVLTDRCFKTHNGDSGAWIIEDDSNKLIGMLWGEQDDLLHFTPINEIFQHIKDELSMDEVKLPPTMPGNSGNLQHICRDEVVQPRRYSTPFKRPQRRLLTGALAGEPGHDFGPGVLPPKAAEPKPNCVGRLGMPYGNESSSPVPSLVGLDSSISDSTDGPESPPPPRPLMLPLHSKDPESGKPLDPVESSTNKHHLEFILNSMTLNPGARIQSSSSNLEAIHPDAPVVG